MDKKLLRRLKRAYKAAMVGLEDIKDLKYYGLSIMDWSNTHITVSIHLYYEEGDDYKTFTYYDVTPFTFSGFYSLSLVALDGSYKTIDNVITYKKYDSFIYIVTDDRKDHFLTNYKLSAVYEKHCNDKECKLVQKELYITLKD